MAVDATYRLLNTMLSDPEAVLKPSTGQSRCPERVSPDCISLEYAQTIGRFTNLLTDLAQKGAVAASMDSLSVHTELPGWIIHLRHAAAHGARPPPLSLLRRAALSLLEDFIIPKYWIPQNLVLECALDDSDDTSSTLIQSIQSRKDARLLDPWLFVNLASGIEFLEEALPFMESELSITQFVQELFRQRNSRLIKAAFERESWRSIVRQTVLKHCINYPNDPLTYTLMQDILGFCGGVAQSTPACRTFGESLALNDSKI